MVDDMRPEEKPIATDFVPFTKKQKLKHAARETRNFVLTAVLTLLPLYWLLLVLSMFLVSWQLALAVFVAMIIYPHILWQNRLEGNGLRSVNILQALVEGLFDYFPIRLYRTTKLNPDKQYLFGYHPHGAFCFGVFCPIFPKISGWEKLFPGVNCFMGVANSLLCIPILCTVFRRLGFIPVTTQAMGSVVQSKSSIMIVPGGIAEMIEVGEKSQEVLVLNNRKGFIRYALTEGLDLVPVYGFGENETYYRYSFLKDLRLELSRRFRLALLLFSGRYYSLVPFQHPVDVVVGKPIPVKKIANPSDQQVEKLLEMYKYSLIQLFEQHKHQIPGYSHRKLVIK
jgi:hypothetical protein